MPPLRYGDPKKGEPQQQIAVPHFVRHFCARPLKQASLPATGHKNASAHRAEALLFVVGGGEGIPIEHLTSLLKLIQQIKY